MTSTPDSYDPYRTRWNGSFQVSGSHNLYVLVDSWSSENFPHGAVWEADEGNNWAEKLGVPISD